MTDSLVNRIVPIWAALPRSRLYPIAAAAGALTALGLDPFSVQSAALLGLSGSLFLALAAGPPRKAFLVGWSYGSGYFALALFWIVEPFLVDIARHGWMAPFALVFMAGGLALFWGAAFAGAAWFGESMGRRAFGWALGLSAAELARGYVLTGFPWALIGYVWTDTPALQWVALVGPFGLTALTLGAVAAFWWALGRNNIGWRLVSAVPLGALFAIGAVLEPDPANLEDRPMVRLIQPNAPQHLKWDPDWMQTFYNRQLSYSAALPEGPPPQLVIWPESAIPWRLEQAGPALDVIARQAGVPTILGVQRRDNGRSHNALIALSDTAEVTQIYDKQRLVPFGEYIPLGGLARYFGLRSFAAQDGYGYSAGPAKALIDTGALGLALPLICYEAIFPQHVNSARTRASYILQITNDAWFGKVSGPYQHLAQARARAIEQGLPVVRVANTGISAVIDAGGHIRAQIPLGQAGFLDAALPPPGAPTLYSRTKDMPVFLLLLVSVAILTLTRPRLN